MFVPISLKLSMLLPCIDYANKYLLWNSLDTECSTFFQISIVLILITILIIMFITIYCAASYHVANDHVVSLLYFRGFNIDHHNLKCVFQVWIYFCLKLGLIICYACVMDQYDRSFLVQLFALVMMIWCLRTKKSLDNNEDHSNYGFFMYLWCVWIPLIIVNAGNAIDTDATVDTDYIPIVINIASLVPFLTLVAAILINIGLCIKNKVIKK